MIKIDFEKITFVFTWAVVFLVLIFYFLYKALFVSVSQMILALTPSIIFMVGMILFYSRDRKVVKKSKEKGEYYVNKELNWGLALKHDFLTFFIPFLIIIMPFLFNDRPDLIDIGQAILAYITLTYLKFIYWGEI